MKNTKTYYQYEVVRCGVNNFLEDPAKKYTSADSMVKFFQSLNFHNSEKEHCYVVSLGTRLNIKGYSLVSVGSMDFTTMHPREIFRPAIFSGAHRIVIVHNHPSGSIKPSKQDVHWFKRIYDSGIILGIELADFVIVTEDVFGQFIYFSFYDQNMFDNV